MTKEHPGLIRRAIGLFLAAAVVLGLLFFGTAGTLDYWQAWVYLATLLTPMAALLLVLARRDPDLLERRLRARERRTQQQRFMVLASITLLASFVIPGLSQRFGWPTVPAPISVAFDLVVLAGYALFSLVLRVNTYAARTIQVESGQKVVTDGPYRWVRHPMYAASMVLYLASPIALGSLWAVVPALILPFLLAARIRDEERMLERDLEGYRAYQVKTRYRLIPGIW